MASPYSWLWRLEAKSSLLHNFEYLWGSKWLSAEAEKWIRLFQFCSNINHKFQLLHSLAKDESFSSAHFPHFDSREKRPTGRSSLHFFFPYLPSYFLNYATFHVSLNIGLMISRSLKSINLFSAETDFLFLGACLFLGSHKVFLQCPLNRALLYFWLYWWNWKIHLWPIDYTIPFWFGRKFLQSLNFYFWHNVDCPVSFSVK